MNRIDIPWRVQIGGVICCYAGVVVFSAAILTARYIAARRSPNDFNGGMAAFGDWILWLFIAGLLLIPTTLLALVIRNREDIYARFAKVLFGLSLTAPAGFGILFIPSIAQNDTLLGSICLVRVSTVPLVLTLFGAGRLLARFKPAKRLTSLAMLIEGGTLVLMVASMVFSVIHH